MKKFLINVLCLIVTLSLTSCFSMNIAMNANKESGTLSINYSFDDDDFEIVEDSDDDDDDDEEEDNSSDDDL